MTLSNALYPQRALITRSELNLIKILRQNGIEVNIETNGSLSVNYVVEKGIKEFIEHPLTLFVAGIPISVIINLYSSHLYDVFSGSTKNSELVIQKQESGTTVSYSQNGEKLSKEQFETIFDKSRELFFTADYKEKPTSPDPGRCPHPIYLEHTNKIVGWGNVSMGKQGLMLSDGFITDDHARKLVDNGTLKGLSVTGVVKKSECSICKGNYFECAHISGETYDGVKCINNITDIELVTVNLVREPVNPEALLKIGQ